MAAWGYVIKTNKNDAQAEQKAKEFVNALLKM